MAAETITGACNCGAIHISFAKTSFPDSCSFCHCLGCRASSGGLFSVNLVIPIKEVTIQGKLKIYADSDTGSGNTVNRHFCGDCGSAIFSVVKENPELAYVKGGLFAKAGVELPAPGYEVWWKRHEPWEEPVKGAMVIE